jgi:dinuclear metal center YbgI/SA1388 family protein
VNVSKLLETVNSLAPLDCAFEDDFVGITIGSENSKINGLAVAHELENNILKYSIDNDINTLITYHPPSMKKKLEEDGTESFEEEALTSKFREAGINIISIHTAQDVCKGGNADLLVDLFEMTNTKVFAHTTGEFGAGRIGQIPKMTTKEFIKSLEAKLNTRIVRTNKYLQTLSELKTIAVLPGSGTQFLDEVISKADVFITGDISHRYLLKGDETNLGLIQVNHLSTEIPGMKKFVSNLSIELGTELKYFYNKYYE